MSPMFSRNFACQKCEGDIGKSVEQEEKLCDEVATVWKFTHLGDRESAGRGCEAVLTAIQVVGGLSLGSVVNCYEVADFV